MAINTPNPNDRFLSWGFPPDPHQGPLGELAQGLMGIHLIQAGYYAATTALISLLIASPAGVLGGMILGATSWLTGLGAREVTRWAIADTPTTRGITFFKTLIVALKILIATTIGIVAMSLAGIPITLPSVLLLESLSLLLIPLSSLATLLSTNMPWVYASHTEEAPLPPRQVAADLIGNRPLAYALPPDVRESPLSPLIGDSVGSIAFSNLCQAGYYAAVPGLLLGGVGALLGVTSWVTGVVARQVVKWGNLMDKPWAMLAIVICKIFAAAVVSAAALMLLGAPITFFAALPALIILETALLILLPVISNTMLMSTTLPMLFATADNNIEGQNEPEPVPSPTVMLGADLITDEILKGASESELQLFVEMDPSLFPFIATKAIFLYTLGAKRLEEIPHFFQPDTRMVIEFAREAQPNPAPEVVAFMEPFFETLEQFNNSAPQLPTALASFNAFRECGSEETQGHDGQSSLLITSSYQVALTTIEAGASFIKDEIGANASANTLQLFQQKAFAFRHFVATKALFIYSLGEKRLEKIPHFFRPATREQIQFLRDQPSNPEFIALMQPFMATLEEFTNAAPENLDLADLLALLKNHGAEEIQDPHSLLDTHCYQIALTDNAAVAT